MTAHPTSSMPSDWLTPQWPAPSHVHALCTTRQGGFSAVPYDSMNLGLHVGDDASRVARNRAHLEAVRGGSVRFLNQVHGTEVLEIDAATADGVCADAASTCASDVACAVMVADCLPMLWTDLQGQRVAAAHAGWRGLAGDACGLGVVETVWQHYQRMQPSGTCELMVWLGPCIGPRAFEVGPEVRAAFVAHSPQAAQAFTPQPSGKYLANLPLLARQRLQALGVTQIYGNDGSDAWCTVGNASRFFSYRRDGVSGRFAACIWRSAG